MKKTKINVYINNIEEDINFLKSINLRRVGHTKTKDPFFCIDLISKTFWLCDSWDYEYTVDEDDVIRRNSHKVIERNYQIDYYSVQDILNLIITNVEL